MSKKWTEAPGVLLFFELRPVVEQMPNDDAGALLKEILKLMDYQEKDLCSVL